MINGINPKFVMVNVHDELKAFIISSIQKLENQASCKNCKDIISSKYKNETVSVIR